MRSVPLFVLVAACVEPSSGTGSASAESSSSATSQGADEAGSSGASSGGSTAGTDTGGADTSSASSGSSSGDCEVDTDRGSICTSQQMWTDGDQASTLMRPGAPCIDCHADAGGAPLFAVAGTVYPTLHEPTDCYGAAGDVVVRITGSDGATIDLPVGSSGNFFASTSAGIVFPIRADVLFEDRVRAMCGWQSNGDCNLCHTEEGANGAPGRIRLP